MSGVRNRTRVGSGPVADAGFLRSCCRFGRRFHLPLLAHFFRVATTWSTLGSRDSSVWIFTSR